jgi:GNAT superfamily N-acetyltransferase
LAPLVYRIRPPDARVLSIVPNKTPTGRIAMPIELVELRSEAELGEAFPVIRELHHELDERKYANLLAEMIPNGYRLFAIRDSGEVVAAVGMQVLTNLYLERHAYVYDLVTTARTRSKGHGEELMKHVEDLARREGCNFIALACGREREEALRFYERLGFERPGYSMRKALR